MKQNIYITIFLSTFLFIEGAWAACAIEKGPPVELVNYINSVKTELAKIRQEAGAQNQCTGKAGTFSSEKRFLETLDRIDLDGSLVDTATNLPGDILTDFLYNVTFAVEGNTRGPVTNQGKLFKNLENTTIVPALESVTTMCALDVTLPSGGTAENRISRILRNHRKLERFFWQVTLGDPTLPTDLEAYSGLTLSIRDNYHPSKTSSCTSDTNIEGITSQIMDRLGKLTKSTKNSHSSWEEAIELFQGKNKGTAKYIQLQSRLLQAEMSRQGLSTNAKKAILSNLTCPEQKTDPISSPEERAKANYECQKTLMVGLETITSPFEALILKARTTDEYIARAIVRSRERTRMSTDMGKFWTTLIKLKSSDEALNDKLLNDLISMHSELVITSEALKTSTKEMIDNCRLAGDPGICPTAPPQ